ncbi:MAG: response regulator [Planctomycetota bacterium]|jgi:two-component system cell cycle response regulator
MTDDTHTTDEQSDKAREALAELPAADITQSTVLIVDDHEQNLELLQAYLEELGCRTIGARDGFDAIEMVERHSPDLVLLDVMMPRMSGFQVCEKIKSDPATRDIPVVMVTALNEVADVERAVESGANDFLSKPVHKIELTTRVRSLLQLRMLKQQQDELIGRIKKLTDAD